MGVYVDEDDGSLAIKTAPELATRMYLYGGGILPSE